MPQNDAQQQQQREREQTIDDDFWKTNNIDLNKKCFVLKEVEFSTFVRIGFARFYKYLICK